MTGGGYHSLSRLSKRFSFLYPFSFFFLRARSKNGKRWYAFETRITYACQLFTTKINRVTLSFFPFSSLHERIELNGSDFRSDTQTKEKRWKKVFYFLPHFRLRFGNRNRNCINLNSIFSLQSFLIFFLLRW